MKRIDTAAIRAGHAGSLDWSKDDMDFEKSDLFDLLDRIDALEEALREVIDAVDRAPFGPIKLTKVRTLFREAQNTASAGKPDE